MENNIEGSKARGCDGHAAWPWSQTDTPASFPLAPFVCWPQRRSGSPGPTSPNGTQKPQQAPTWERPRPRAWGAQSRTRLSSAFEEEQDLDGEKGPSSEGPEEEDGEGFSFKYSPGKLRGNQYKKMMTKEELEEEQRVQKEQLAAIFKLMKDNKETFGEMSDGDVQEQLRLYDM
ncbi:matrix-remodeling-associated protein 7 isoform 7 [Homo sapiens]|uniref:matrix-remodeling-associated protein 7 isoform 7 n=1 Tax=Homo sapiens TaxID=9606 RepID=UPI0005D00C24|nr:matrix-remodeling-associated protein 7 isoform 7 [Homo sapiens]|eukprot:XP_011523132.1 matrix-remodeling-associated protein 7 isoform X4 [Homo sapiens]